MHATAIFLRGGVAPPQVLIQARLFSLYSHAGLYLSNGQAIEASALENAVVCHDSPRPVYCWERRLPLDHLGIYNQKLVAAIAGGMVGDKYDWRAARGMALEGLTEQTDDPRREVCFEVVGRACEPFLTFAKPLHEIEPCDIIRAWKQSRC